MACSSSGGGRKRCGCRFSLPHARCMSCWNATMRWISLWPKRIASSTTSSESSCAPASTIMTASCEPATVRFSVETARCSSVGLMTNSSLTRPTRTPAIGPSNGMSETVSAALAPIMPAISGALSWSTESTVATICTSLRKPFGNSGRMGRSMRRAQSVASLDGRPSRLMKPPGILPAAYIFSS